MTLPLAYISLSISKFPLFRPFASSEPLTHTLNSAGPVCKPVSILLQNYDPPAPSMACSCQIYKCEVFQYHLSLILTGNLTHKPICQVRNTLFHQHNGQIYTKTYMHLETCHSIWKLSGEYAAAVTQIWTSSLGIWRFAVVLLEHDDSSNRYKYSFVFC